MINCDYLIIGGGIVGAAAGYELSKAGKVVILEKEHILGYHTTGRSAAITSVNFVSPIIHDLGLKSRDFFLSPPLGFTESPLTSPRRSLWLARKDQQDAFNLMAQEVKDRKFNVLELEPEEALVMCPVIKRELVWRALYEPDTLDLDVHAIHNNFIRGIKQRSGEVILNARVESINQDDVGFELLVNDQKIKAKILLNAAGAWADQIAALVGAQPIGLEPLLRTVFTFKAPEDAPSNSWPMIYDIEEKFYFKLENGIILASLMDEQLSKPADVYPDYNDIALAADRIQNITHLKFNRIERKWAGLRVFAKDKEIVVGRDPKLENFYWLTCFGGVGIMVSPAIGELVFADIVEGQFPTYLSNAGLTPQQISPKRFKPNAVVF